MKIKNLTIRGFRGFNEEQTIDFHDRLTLIYAPNSYGKTSISEALEWLLYGSTSKVDRAGSKEEYRGSYRNCHLPEPLFPFVRLRLSRPDGEIVFEGELASDDTMRKFVGEGETRIEVPEWPLGGNLSEIPRPFILQHALKYLLLVNPDARFQGFARLLGLEDLGQIQRDIISLCTAPERRMPSEIRELQRRVLALEARVANRRSLSSIQKALKRKGATPAGIYEAVLAECRSRVPNDTQEESLLAQLLRIREEATRKIFKGRIDLAGYSASESENDSHDEALFVACLADAFIKQYTDLAALAGIDHILKEAKFFELGRALLDERRARCPFCSQPIDEQLAEHINREHKRVADEAQRAATLSEQRTKVKETLHALESRLSGYQTRHLSKTQALLDLGQSLEELREILMPKYETHFRNVEAAISSLGDARKAIEDSYQAVAQVATRTVASVDSSTEDLALIKALGDALVQYVADARWYARAVSEKTETTAEANQVLQHELDALAGTEDVSLLIDLIDQWPDVEKRFQIEAILSSLKDLRKVVDQYVANRMLTAISGDLTSEVMQWYDRIRTSGDPDVHFDGFDLDRTQAGQVRARRVRIKARSYGEDLVSAVSSLSESKLNALGLCVSIATNLRDQSPLEFLIIDDPIQSLDSEHETQFIEVIRALVDKHGRQVILLSHNQKWLEQLRLGCQTLNGWCYEITGYTQAGPNMAYATWQPWQQRLAEVDAVAKDLGAGSIKLEQAEEEIRIIVCQITAELYRRAKGQPKNPNSLNARQVRKALIECGVEAGLVDRIGQTFGTTDASHHAPADYHPDRERIRRYYGWASELAGLLSR